jgi:Tol biopolymer transport system component
LNSTANDFGAGESKDGLTLYFTSTRDGGFGSEDIWVSRRASLDEPWGTPENLGSPINTSGLDRVPALSRDGHWMFFARLVPGESDMDIWSSYRAHTHDDTGPFGWQEPARAGALNGPMFDLAPSYFQAEDGRAYLFFASNRPSGTQDYDIYVAEETAEGTFGPASLVSALSVPLAQDAKPTIRHDGLEIVFHSNRPGAGGFDLWSSTRATPDDEWSAPLNLGTVNSSANELQPALSADGLRLYVSTNRPGGLAGNDLWLSTRVRLTGRQ